MSENTKIQWATHTWNPWIGCTKVSPGCANCYAEHSATTRVARSNGRELWGRGRERQRTSAGNWTQPLRWQAAVEKDPSFLSLRVFPSLCDWLDDEVPIDWLADFLKLMHETPHIDWLLLTKRPENFRRVEFIYEEMFKLYCAGDGPSGGYTESGKKFYAWLTGWVTGVKIPENIWAGVSVEDELRAYTRKNHIPSTLRFLSVEPLLERVSLDLEGISWVIVGGESGPKARACRVDWVRDVVEQCRRHGVPCFVKQLGARPVMPCWPDGTEAVAKLKDPKGGDMEEWPEDLRVREWPASREFQTLPEGA